MDFVSRVEDLLYVMLKLAGAAHPRSVARLPRSELMTRNRELG